MRLLLVVTGQQPNDGQSRPTFVCVVCLVRAIAAFPGTVLRVLVL